MADRSPSAEKGPDPFSAFVRDIKLEHSLFALPFALLGMLLGTASQVAGGRRGGVWPTAGELGWIVVAMVGTRTAAMGFNRLVDRRLDALNPRTKGRALPAGRATPGAYVGFILAGIALLLVAAWRLNPLALKLTPAVLVIVLGYSYTKRLTVLCHWFVGLALAISPLGAWVAVTGAIPRSPAVYLLSLAVMLWVGGFDILYACLDLDSDLETGIHSVPSWLGVPRALGVAKASHLLMVVSLVGVVVTAPPLGFAFGVGVAIAAVILAWEHSIVRPDDLARVNTAFFTLNSILGLLLLVAGLGDLLRIR